MAVYPEQIAQSLPEHKIGPLAWCRKNLFSSWTNSLLTLALLYTLIPPFWHLVQWAFIQADWVGDQREQCDSGGACWVFINVRFSQFIYGFYPDGERWRVDLMFALCALQMAALMIKGIPGKKWFALSFFGLFPWLALWLLRGGILGLASVETHYWGGLMLTLVLALVGIVAALPIGIILALGRRSSMPVVNSISVVFIEFWRAVPLITVLFMASVMLPLFLSAQVELDKLLRALIGIILFQSAYMAEVIRGGLQAIPKGQYEAAEALGLSYWRSMGLVILPQALKITIPSIVNTFIALFKDTSLVTIIGLFDLLAVGKAGLSDPNWLGYSVEAYVFIALIFWIFCFGMSRYSQYLERQLHTGHKH
ncbi:amino acid ABC transporter permease [Pseudaeromonas pectinilytica]